MALQQTERVIGMIQLMREYLDAEQPGPEACSAALAPVLRSVIEELSSIAAVGAFRYAWWAPARLRCRRRSRACGWLYSI